MADNTTHSSPLGGTFSNNLSAMANSAAQSNHAAAAIRAGHPPGMSSSQLVQALGHDYSNLRQPFLGTPAQNELAAQQLVQHIFQAQAQAQAQAAQAAAAAGANMAGLAGMNPNAATAQHHALNAGSATNIGMGSGLLSAAAAAAAAGLGLNMSPGGGMSVGGGAGAGLQQHMHGLMGGLGMAGLGQQQQHQAAALQMQQQQQQQQAAVGFPPFPGGLPPMLSPTDYQHEMLPPDLLAASHLMSSLPHHDLAMQADVSSTDGREKCPNMSWLDAAELVLKEAKTCMHLQDIKQRILEKGLVSSGARSSLEAVIYRDTQRGSRRFRRVDGEIGVFRLITQEEKDEMLRKKRRAAAAKRKSAAARNMAVAKAKRYKEKFHNLRKLIKMMIFENAALCDEVARTEEKMSCAKEERRFLLQRLLQYQSLTDVASGQGSHDGGKRSHGGQQHGGSKKDGDKRVRSKHKHKKAKKAERDREKQKLKDKAAANSAKHRRRRSASTAVKRLVQPVPLDSLGKPIFPIILGSLTVHSLGEIISERPGFHDNQHIFPAGFCSSRYYVSMRDPSKQCLYTCKILDGGPGPKFEISAEDNTDMPLVGSTATICHNQLIKAINEISKKEAPPNATTTSLGAELVLPITSTGWGAEFFGYAHPTIHNLIQNSAGSRKCTLYKWIKFEECKSADKSFTLHWNEDNVNMSFEAFQKHRTAQKDLATSTSTEPSTQSTTSDPTSLPPGHSLRTLLTTGLRPEEATQASPDEASQKMPETSSPQPVKPPSLSPHITRTATGSLTRSGAKATTTPKDASSANAST